MITPLVQVCTNPSADTQLRCEVEILPCVIWCQCCHPLRRRVAQAAQAGVREANGTIQISLCPGTSAWVERTASSQLWRLPGLIVTCLRSLGGPWEAGQGSRGTWLSPAHHSQASWDCLCTSSGLPLLIHFPATRCPPGHGKKDQRGQ